MQDTTRGRVSEIACVAAAFLAATLVMTYPLLRHLGRALPGDLGDPLLNTWILAWDADRILHGFEGLWRAPMFFPYPNTLAYSEHLLGIALFTAPVQWLSNNVPLPYNVAFLGSFVLAGTGMYLLVQQLTDDRRAAAVAGLAYAFCPYRAAQLSHLQVLMSGWMPVGLWALHRYLDESRRRFLVAFVAAFLLQGLSNGYYLYFFAVPVTVIAAHHLLRARGRRWRLFAELSLAALVLAAALAPIATIYFDVRRERGFLRDVTEISRHSGDVAAYLHVVPELRVWGRVLRTAPGELALFPGATIVGLATLALVPRRKQSGGAPSLKRPVGPYWFIAGAAFFLSLGPEPRAWGTPLPVVGPYAWLLEIVPGLDGLRVPARLAMIVVLALSVLAGMGVANVFERCSVAARNGLSVLLAVLLLAEGYAGPVRREVVPRFPPEDAAAFDWLAAQPPGGVLALPAGEGIESLRYVIRTLEHRHALVNGYSGYTTPLWSFLTGPATPLHDANEARFLLQGLRRIGVRFVILHQSLYGDLAAARHTLEMLEAQRDQVDESHAFGRTTVLRLRPADAAGQPAHPGRAILPGEFRLEASHAHERVPLASDGKIGTRWVSGDRQTGDEAVTIRFARPRHVARVRLLVSPRSLGDYPRRVRIESSGDGVRFHHVVYDDAILPVLIGALVGTTWPAVIDLDLVPNRSHAIRIRQVGQTRVWFWAIDELQLFDAALP